MTNDGVLDRPHVFIPPAQSALGPPLLLLHGTGGSEHDLLPLRDRLSPGAAVLAVRGTVLEDGMTRFFRRLREGVFDEDDLRQRTDELAEFIQAANRAYDLSAGDLVAVGFSNGANIASSLLLRHPSLLGGAVLLSAMVPFQQPPDADLSGRLIVISNGARDSTIAADITHRLVDQLRVRGAEVVELPHQGGHQPALELLPSIRKLITRPERPGSPTTRTGMPTPT